MLLAAAAEVEGYGRRRMQWHAIKRAEQRHSLALWFADIEFLSATILGRGPGVVPLRTSTVDPNRREVAVWFAGEWRVVVFCDLEKSVVTFLPRERAEPYARVLQQARHRMKVLGRKKEEV